MLLGVILHSSSSLQFNTFLCSKINPQSTNALFLVSLVPGRQSFFAVTIFIRVKKFGVPKFFNFYTLYNEFFILATTISPIGYTNCNS
jgi:hypothetical protein